ncbi:MAG TPA: gliding motility-associated C-terminal domain-containing protein [Arachidicoccus soli]|nr:gliding motility-associated C-terminal domain-containing protein [Arachidicoccus soli]
MLNKKVFFLFAILILNFVIGYGQEIYYQDIYKGGVSTFGTSSGISGTQGVFHSNFEVNIPTNSIIKKAFLIFSNVNYNTTDSALLKSSYENFQFSFNGENYSINLSQKVLKYLIGNTSIKNELIRTYALDVTQSLLPIQNSYNLEIPEQKIRNGSFMNCYYLIVYYTNPYLGTISTSLILNNQNLLSKTNIYDLNDLNPINYNKDIGFAIDSDILWDTTYDGSHIYVNGQSLGLIGGTDENDSLYTSAGVKGCFVYQDSLMGLSDDTADSLMGGSDGLAKINSYIAGNSFSFKLETQFSMNIFNNYIAFPLVYSTPCAPFPITVSADTTLCPGETVQLYASGGIKYEWASTALSPQSSGNPAPGLSCSDCASPTFSGDSSQVYTVRIWSTDSCSVVRPVRIGVRRPKNNVFIAAPSDCISPTGIISYNEDAATWNGIISWQLVNENGDTITSKQKSIKGLAHGTYYLTLTDTFGCKSAIDTLTILPNNNTVASFQATPLMGTAPFAVAINNSSVHANQFEWFINGVSQGSSLPQFQIDTSGYYTILLVASQNGICLDTVGELVYAKEGLLLTIPQLLTPNGDYKNDTWKITGIEKYPHNEVTVFNRWGNVVFHQKNYQNNWNGIPNVIAIGGKDKLPNGTYFYVVKIQNKGKEQVFKGYLEVER